MSRLSGGGRFLRLFSGAVLDQAMLSAANFAVGLMLIRQASDEDYGHYVLAFNALLLLTSLLGSLISHPLSVLAPKKTAVEKKAMTVTMYRLLSKFMWRFTPISLTLLTAVTLTDGISTEYTLLIAAFLVATHAAIDREYLRAALMMYSRPQAVLAADALYCLCLLSGAGLAISFVQPVAPTVVAVIAVASMAGAALARQFFGRDPGWSDTHLAGALKEVLTLGYWAAAGCLIYWLFNQGYSYLAAIRLDIAAVAGLAATRLLLMPVNLLTTGIKQLLTPTAARWCHERGLRVLLQRLCLLTLGIMTLMGAYDLVLWLLRDWIATELLQKQILDLDRMLALWMLIFALSILRDQVMLVLLVHERFQSTAWLTLGSAVVSLSSSWWAMAEHGAVGALIGLALGELLSLCGVLLLTGRLINIKLAIANQHQNIERA